MNQLSVPEFGHDENPQRPPSTQPARARLNIPPGFVASRQFIGPFRMTIEFGGIFSIGSRRPANSNFRGKDFWPPALKMDPCGGGTDLWRVAEFTAAV
jgi:hypothetical protein